MSIAQDFKRIHEAERKDQISDLPIRLRLIYWLSMASCILLGPMLILLVNMGAM